MIAGRAHVICALVVLAGCSAPTPEPEGYAFSIWRDGVSTASRAEAIGACQLVSYGVGAAADQGQIRAAAETVDEREVDRRFRACLAGRGYAVVEFPLCRPEDRQSGQLRPISLFDALPPQSAVACIDPSVDAVLVRR